MSWSELDSEEIVLFSLLEEIVPTLHNLSGLAGDVMPTVICDLLSQEHYLHMAPI